MLSFAGGVLYGRGSATEADRAVAAQAQPQPPPQAAQVTQPAPVTPEPVVNAPAPKPAAEPPANMPQQVAPPPTAAPRPDQVRLAIQITSLRDPALANQHKQQLVRQGLPAFVEPVMIGGADERYRVLVGPFTSRADADAALLRVQRDPRFSGSFVRPY